MTTGSVVVILVAAGFWIYCLVDFSRTDGSDMQVFTRPVWIVLLAFGSVLGALLWFFLGRPERRT